MTDDMDARARVKRLEAENARLLRLIRYGLMFVGNRNLEADSGMSRDHWIGKASEALATPARESEPSGLMCDYCGQIKAEHQFYDDRCNACAHPTPEQAVNQRGERFPEKTDTSAKLERALHIARNPYGWDEGDIRWARCYVCDEVERLQRSLCTQSTPEQTEGKGIHWLRQKIESMPTRTEWMGGQRHRYLNRDVVLEWFDDAAYLEEQTGDALAALDELYRMAEEREPMWLEGACRVPYRKVRQALTASGVPYVPENRYE